MKRIIIFLVILLTTLSFAQHHRYQHGRGPHFNDKTFNERPIQRLQQFKLQKLIEELSITDANKVNNIKQVFNNNFNSIHQLQFEKRNLLDELENAFINNDINKAIDIANKIYVTEKSFINARMKYFDDMKNILNDEEYAKFVLFEFRFQQLVKNFMDERKK